MGYKWFGNVKQHFMAHFHLQVDLISQQHMPLWKWSVLAMCYKCACLLQDSDVYYIPTSGLSGENLTTRSKVADLTAWYTGPCLLEQIGGCLFYLHAHRCTHACTLCKQYNILEYNAKYYKIQYNVIVALLFLITQAHFKQRSFFFVGKMFCYMRVSR